jgi:diguanylate cyclase (GGDEF)-like protein
MRLNATDMGTLGTRQFEGSGMLIVEPLAAPPLAPLSSVIAAVAGAMRAATSVATVCQAALAALPARGAVMLARGDRLRYVAATGDWPVFSTAWPDGGVVGPVYATGRAAATATRICAPIEDMSGPIGVIDLEWSEPVDLTVWRPTIEEIARRLGERVAQVGGRPVESRDEMLLRHALAFTTAASEEELLIRLLRAARDVSGLAGHALVLRYPDRLDVVVDRLRPTEAARVVAVADRAELAAVIENAQRCGGAFWRGPSRPARAAFGARAMIVVPIGTHPESGAIDGVLVAVAGAETRPDVEVIRLLELLAAHAWSGRERLRMLHSLRVRATSDPLTGLRHQGSFGERLAQAHPGRTAVFTMDIDGFKAINDTYGHQAGDRVLVDLAQVLASALHDGDELFRIGGDEFAAVVELSSPPDATTVAERLVGAARRAGQTISVGVAIQRAGESSDDTLGRADAALYLAKRGGRDGVRLAV